MSSKQYQPIKPGKVLQALVVFGLWGGAQFEIVEAEDLRTAIEAQAVTTFSVQGPESTRERQILDKCAWEQTLVSMTVRDCLVGIVPEIKDWQAARTAAMPLVRWLQDHPADTEAHKAGVQLMDQAWASWYKDYQPAYAKLDAMEADARESSWLFRLGYSGRYGPEFERLQYRLTANLDMAVVSPEASKRYLDRVKAHPDSVLF